jgi:hypothetical protein
MRSSSVRWLVRANAIGWLLAGLAASTVGSARKSPIGADCSFEGHQLYGRIQLVEHFPDVKVQRVKHFEDLRVKLVEHFPQSCGRWKLVERRPDTKVQFVEHFADIRIRYVEHFPGVP